MLAQYVLSVECDAAMLTRVRFLFVMTSFVILHVAFSGKFFAAQCASEGFLFRVNPCVNYQVGPF